MREIKYQIPKVNIVELLEKQGYKDLTKPLLLDKIFCIINMLYRKRVFRSLTTKDNYFELHSEILISLFTTKKYKRYISALLDIGIVETDGKWINGLKSIGYRIKPELCDDDFIKIEPVDKKLVKKLFIILETKQKEQNVLFEKSPEFQIVQKSLSQIDFNGEKALEFIGSQNYSKQKYFALKQKIESMQEESSNEVTKDKYGRFHHKLTNLSKDLRRFVSYQGERLHHADLGSSQPCLLMKYVQDEKWMNLCEQNKFYEFLNSKRKSPLDFTVESERKKLKQKFFSEFLFCCNTKQGELSKIIREEFPAVDKKVYQLKKNNYSNLAKLLQKAESELIIETVIPKFSILYPDVPLISLHDSILTTEKYIFELARFLETSAQTTLNFLAPVKIDEF